MGRRRSPADRCTATTTTTTATEADGVSDGVLRPQEAGIGTEAGGVLRP